MSTAVTSETKPVSVSFQHHSSNILVFAPSSSSSTTPTVPSSRPSTPLPPAVTSRSNTDGDSLSSSPPAYSQSQSQAGPSTPKRTALRPPRTRTWRIEFAMEGQNDNDHIDHKDTNTPYTLKVFIRFTAGAIAGTVGFLASLVALLVMFAFPSLRPRGPEAATYGAGGVGVGVWSPAPKRKEAASVTPSSRLSRMTTSAEQLNASRDDTAVLASGSGTPSSHTARPPSLMERRVTFQLQRTESMQSHYSSQPQSRISTPLKAEISSPIHVVSINTPVNPQFLEDHAMQSLNAIVAGSSSGSRFLEGSSCRTKSPAPSQHSEESSVNGKDKEYQTGGGSGQRRFMRRFMRRRSTKKDGLAVSVSEDEREGSGYCSASAASTQPNTPITAAESEFGVLPSPLAASPFTPDEAKPTRTRRISLKLPGFRRRTVSAVPTPSSSVLVSSSTHPLLLHAAHTMPTSPESIGNASISTSESNTSNSSATTTESNTSNGTGPQTAPPTSFPVPDADVKSGKHKHTKSLSFSNLNSKGAPPPPPTPPRRRPTSLVWKIDHAATATDTDTEPSVAAGPKSKSKSKTKAKRERERKLSLEDGASGALQLRIVTADGVSDAGSDIGGGVVRRKPVLGQRVASDSLVTVSTISSSGASESGKAAKRRSINLGNLGGLRPTNSKPPVTVRPSRHEVTRRYHEGHLHMRELSYSDTEVCR
ncbi:hypothetical protein FRB93_005779 [Tulasnella sp. JGI-2019a]|nr:hypothetical protein FRB93_005779 [Tulasnella sp. JGI-2019a]